MRTQGSVQILTSSITTDTGATHSPISKDRTFMADGATSAGAGAAVIRIEGSLDDSKFVKIADITLTLATVSSHDGFASNAAWRYTRARVLSISGTDATVNVWMGA